MQGHFKAILVDRDAYLLEVCRSVDLNPVRAYLARDPAERPWSSFGALTGVVAEAPWLDAGAVQGSLLGQGATTPTERRRAMRWYGAFEAEGRGVRL